MPALQAQVEPTAVPLRQRRGYFVAVVTTAALVWGLLLASQLPTRESAGAHEVSRTNQAPASAAPLPDSLRREAKEAAQSRDRALTELNGMLQQHFDVTRHETPPLDNPPNSDTPFEAAPAVAPSTIAINPLWREMTERLRQMETQRAELAERFTEQHPQLAQLDADIARMLQQLESTPEMIVPAPASDADPSNAPVEPIPVAPDRQAAADEYQRLWTEFANADRRAAQTQNALRDALTSRLRTPSATSIATDEGDVDAPPTASATWWTYAALVLVVGGVAAAVSLRPPTPDRDEVFSCISDVEAVLPLPIVAATEAARQIPDKNAPASRPMLRRLLVPSEITLAVFALFVVAAAARHPAFLNELLANPVAGVRAGIEQLSQSR